ncbi:elongation factor G [Rhabdothermincola salaria]|uniref:elongation factor G n=1 Tax=Rhabdothermincola salaria TaxID=2903142 RepID=UPI001E3F7964|nr:elongation factor G [Rhabdothermincola salaria]
MQPFAPEKIRNVALVGHSGAGKTSLAEALLTEAGVIARPGRVEEGTTVCDAEPEEQARHMSLVVTLAPFEWKGHKINLLDTPGYADFEAETLAALGAADLAVFVVSAADGVEPQTRHLWKVAASMGLPRMVFVNKLDRDRSDFDGVLAELRDAFGAGVAPLELPIGAEGAFHGVADLLTDTAFLYDDGVHTSGPVPLEMADEEHEVHDNLVEGIVVGDDDMLERYLAGDVPSFEELERVLAVGVDQATVFPVVCGSATAVIGIDRLADLLCEIGPSPLDRPPVEVHAGDTVVSVPPDPTADPLALVVRATSDPFVGQVSLLRVLSGTVSTDTHLVDVRTGADLRLHGLFTHRGRDRVEVSSALAGDLVAVPKVETLAGDTLAPKGSPVVVPAPEWPEPVHAIAVAARSSADEDKLATALHRLVADDPSLRVRRDDETHQTLLAGQGETHLAVALDRLRRKFGVEVDASDVRIAYRETITAEARAEGKYKKQSGGHGQFGVAVVAVAPAARGEGITFVDEVVGGAIPRQFIPAVEKGVREALAEGGPHGFPVVDVVVRCLDGKHHPVDSSEMSFKAAGRLAVREAVAAASPVILEPVSRVEVTVPTASQGDVMGDLNARRARVQGTDLASEDETVITALVPGAELTRYAVDLRARTHGLGRFHAEHDHYDVLPAHLAAAVSTADTGAAG